MEILLLLFLIQVFQLLLRQAALMILVDKSKILRLWLPLEPLLLWNCLAASKLYLRLGMILLDYGILPLMVQGSGHL